MDTAIVLGTIITDQHGELVVAGVEAEVVLVEYLARHQELEPLQVLVELDEDKPNNLM